MTIERTEASLATNDSDSIKNKIIVWPAINYMMMYQSHSSTHVKS